MNRPSAEARPDGGVRWAIGCMSGTSLDGLDAALVRIEGVGLAIRASVAELHALPFPAELGGDLRALAEDRPMKASAVTAAARRLGELHVEACRPLVAACPGRIELVVPHGQTICHLPGLADGGGSKHDDDAARGMSWQLLDPWPIAWDLGVSVCYDLRQADLMAGGQGAPITPIADPMLYGLDRGVVINLGGICNTSSWRRGDKVDGFDFAGADVGPCNLFLDALAERWLDRVAFDEGGRVAAGGTADDGLVAAVLQRIDDARNHAGASLGREQFGQAWVAGVAKLLEIDAEIPNRLASAVEAVARVIASAVETEQADAVVLAGGGTRHRLLCERLAALLPSRRVVTSDELGVPAVAREAAAMAVLGVLSRDGIPITRRETTRCREPGIAGAWASPRLPDTRTASVDRGALPTEQRLSQSDRLDTLTTGACVVLIHAADQTVPAAVEQALPQITALTERVIVSLRSGGRLIYLGAGTSGRLGVLDASECPPTFDTEPSRVVGLIAGGDTALRRSSEGAEDREDAFFPEFDGLRLTASDTVVGIAAGGTTPCVLGGLREAKRRGAATGFVACVPLDPLPMVDFPVCVPTGPEVVTGSTRMKAGTATKLVLNTITTTAMVRLGRVYGNLMVDLRVRNQKLRDRAARILTSQLGLAREDALALLDAADGRVKLAMVMKHRGVAAPEAETMLQQAKGSLRDVIGPPRG
mgnify:CR=1 FL=1